jgi:hypothetical protein
MMKIDPVSERDAYRTVLLVGEANFFFREANYDRSYRCKLAMGF